MSLLPCQVKKKKKDRGQEDYVTSYKSNITARFLPKIAVNKDALLVMVTSLQQHTMENGRWECSQQ